MDRTFTTATDDSLITMIGGAKERLAVIAPGLTTPVAKALAARMAELSTLSLTVILDADAEVYRMGYGDVDALEIIREASSEHMFDLREQQGVRIGVVLSDDNAMVYAPVSRNVEAGSTTEEKPNAIMLRHGGTTESLAGATGVAEGEMEVGMTAMEPDRVAEMANDLKANPPHPFDLSRKLKVFITHVQFIELRIANATFSTRKIQLPQSFQKFKDEALRNNINASLNIPIDLETELEISIDSHRGPETFTVNEEIIIQERREIESTFFYDWKGRGKVVLRKDKQKMDKELERLVAIVEEYHKALRSDFKQSQEKFRNRLVGEFLDLWKESPPSRLKRRGTVGEESCRLDIEAKADMMFHKAVHFGKPEVNIVYKDISIEDLKNEKLMASLRQLMEKAGVDQATVKQLFQSGDAAAAKNSFPTV